MGKYTGKSRNDTKVLYKKSNITCTTQSRTLSEVSQGTRGGISKIKKNGSKTNVGYSDAGTIMRDLSIETDICVLRRFCKRQRYKHSEQGVSSAKTKCSTLTDIGDTGDEYKPDASACGDSLSKSEDNNQIPQSVDIAALMLDNLKSLLNDWIRQHVVEDDITKQKLIHILDSILQNLDHKISSKSSSCSTYVLDRNGYDYRVHDRKTATCSITCQYCRQKLTAVVFDKSSSAMYNKYSRCTIPFPYRHFRIISTLSIPRNIHTSKIVKRRKKHAARAKRGSKNNANFQDKKNRKVLNNESSNTPSSLTKRSETKSNRHKRRVQNKRRGIVIIPELFYDSTTECMSTSENYFEEKVDSKNMHVEAKAIPSLVKSIYADPANVRISENNIKGVNRHDTFTMTDASISKFITQRSVSNIQYHEATYKCRKTILRKPNFNSQEYQKTSKLKYINHSLEFPNLTHQTKVGHQTKRVSENHTRQKTKKNTKTIHKPMIAQKHKTKRLKYGNIKYKQFTYLFRKTNNNDGQGKDFLNHLQNILRYFSRLKGKRDIKLEVHVDVYPSINIKEQVSSVRTKSFEGYEMKVSNTVPLNDALETDKICNANAQVFNPAIIPILDGAASQAKYIFKCENSTSNSKSDTVANDFNERGTAMTGLEVSKELSNLKYAIRELSLTAEKIVAEHLKNLKEKEKLPVSMAKITKKAVSNDKSIKVSKGIQYSNTVAKSQALSGLKLSKGPKKVEEFTNRLKKRSSSYHVIDSESIIKVTDMTSSLTKPKLVGNSSCPPNIQKPLFNNEVNQQRLLAFFCDDSKKVNNPHYTMASQPCNKPSDTIIVLEDFPPNCNHSYCRTEQCRRPIFNVKKKGGMSCLESALYCILLLIPIIVILYYFYVCVLKASPNTYILRADTAPAFRATRVALKEKVKNESQLMLQLSDLGF